MKQFYDLVLLKHTSPRHQSNRLYHNIDEKNLKLDVMLAQLTDICQRHKVACMEPPSLIGLLPKHYIVGNQSLLGEFENLTNSSFEKIQQFMVKIFLLLDKNNFKSVESIPLNKILAEDWKVKLIESATDTKQVQALQNEILQLKADQQTKARELSLLLQKQSQQQESDLNNVLDLQKQCTELKRVSITQPLPNIKLLDSVQKLAKTAQVGDENTPLDEIPVLAAEKFKLLHSQLSCFQSGSKSVSGSTLLISKKEMRQQQLKQSCGKNDLHILLPEMEDNNYSPVIQMIAKQVGDICSRLGFNSFLNDGIVSQLGFINQKIQDMLETNKSLQCQIVTKNEDLNKVEELYQNILLEFKQNYINKNQLLTKENIDLQTKNDASIASLQSIKQQYLLSCDYLVSEMGICLEETNKLSLFDTITRSISAIKQQLYMMSSLSYDEDSEFPNVTDNQPLFQQLINLNEKIVQSITFCEQYGECNQNQANVIQQLEEQVYNQKSEISNMESYIQKLCQQSEQVQLIIQSFVPKSQDSIDLFELFQYQISNITKSISTVLNCDNCSLYDLVNLLLLSYDKLKQNQSSQSQTINQLNDIILDQQQKCQNLLTTSTKFNEIRIIMNNLLSLSKKIQVENSYTHLQEIITVLLSKHQFIYFSFADQSLLVKNLTDQNHFLKAQVQSNPAVQHIYQINKKVSNLKSEIADTKLEITNLSTLIDKYKLDLNNLISKSINCFNILPLKIQIMFQKDCSYIKTQLLQIKQDHLQKQINFDSLNTSFRSTSQLTQSLHQQVLQMESFFDTSQQLLKQNIQTISSLNEQVEAKNQIIHQQCNEMDNLRHSNLTKDSSIQLLSESLNAQNQTLQSIKQQNQSLSNQNQQMNQVHFVLQQRADDSESLIQQLKLSEEAFRDNLHLSTSVCIQEFKRLLVSQKQQLVNMIPDWQKLEQLLVLIQPKHLEYSDCMEGIQYLKNELNIDLEFPNQISFMNIIQQLFDNFKINKNLQVDQHLADQFSQHLLGTESENILQLLQEEFNIEMVFQSNTNIFQKIRLLLDYFKLSLGFRVDQYLANQITKE